MLTSAGGFSIKEYLDTKITEAEPVPVVAAPEISAVVSAPPVAAEKAKIYGLPPSCNTMAAALFAMHTMGDKVEFTPCDIMTGAQNTDEFGAINPFRQIPAFTDVDGKSLGDSNAIILYVAEKYGEEYLMKGETTAVWGLESVSSYVYGGGFCEVVYPVMGFKPMPADGFQPDVEKLLKNLATFEQVFLKGKFIGGEKLCVADFKLAPMVETFVSPTVKSITGFTCPERYVQFLADFKAASPASAMLTSAGGFSIKEYLDTKMPEPNKRSCPDGSC